MVRHTNDHYIASLCFFRQLRWLKFFSQILGMACRSPFCSTHHGTTGFWSRLEPPRLDRRTTWVTGRVHAPKGPQIGGFLATLGHIQFQCAVLLKRYRARDAPQAEWAIGWTKERFGQSTGLKVPAFRTPGERGFGRRRPSGNPQGTAAPAPDPDPGGRRTLAAKSKFPCFLTNCVINGIAPRGHPTTRF